MSTQQQDTTTMLDSRPSTRDTQTGRAHAPVFLVGSERSGTTLLRLMLDQHPEVTWCKEFEFVVDPVRGGKMPSIQEYAQYLETSRIFNSTKLTLREDLDFKGACQAFLDQRREMHGKPYVGATVHRHFATLLEIWPDARFIYLKRDGRDVTRSCIGMGWDGNMWTASKRWFNSVKEWNALREILAPDRYIETSYEQLILDTRGELARLFDFIGPGFHEEVWRYHEGTSYGEPDPSLIAQWKRKLTKHEVALAEARLAPMLDMQGYEPSGYPPVKVTPLMQKKLYLQDRWYRMTYRWRRFGMLLSISESITKRTGPKVLHTRILKKIHAIQNATKR